MIVYTTIKQRPKGIALITVMLVVALAAVILVQMTSRLQLQMQRTENINFNQQAYWYAMGAEAFAKRVLITSFEEDNKITHLGQTWAQGKTSYPVDFGEITGEIKDLHSCFNLNALRAPKADGGIEKKSLARQGLEELLQILEIKDVSQFEAEYMADALSDWLDEDSAIASAGGAEDNDYAAREFPLLPGNHYIASVKELRVIEHFTLPVLYAIKDYVCVIPDTNLHQININTVSAEKPELLQALLGIPKEDAEQALTARDEEGFQSIDEFYNLKEIKKHKLSDEQKEQFVVDSEYFTLKTTASFNNSYFALNSIMKVEKNDQISVISRTVGKD